MGFERIQSDRSIYIYKKGDVQIILPVFVDDLTLVSKSEKALDDTIGELQKHFKLRDLGETQFLLGIEIIRDRSKRSISLCQRQYIVDLLERFGMQDCNGVTTPMEPGLSLTRTTTLTPEEQKEMSNIPYLSAVGGLSHLSLTTRPDIQQPVSTLARFNSNPGPEHWKAVKHVMRYLQRTKDLNLHTNLIHLRTYSLVTQMPITVDVRTQVILLVHILPNLLQELSAGQANYKQLLLYPLLKQSTWLLFKLGKKYYG